MSKIEPWTQEELQTERQPEAPVPWYEITLRIGAAFLVAGFLLALLWPVIAHR